MEIHRVIACFYIREALAKVTEFYNTDAVSRSTLGNICFKKFSILFYKTFGRESNFYKNIHWSLSWIFSGEFLESFQSSVSVKHLQLAAPDDVICVLFSLSTLFWSPVACSIRSLLDLSLHKKWNLHCVAPKQFWCSSEKMYNIFPLQNFSWFQNSLPARRC